MERNRSRFIAEAVRQELARGHEQRGVRARVVVSEPSVNADQRYPLIAVVP